MFKGLLRSEFLKSIFVLMTGTAVAQIINVLSAPILTRLYTQEEMGELGLYMRIVAFAAAISTLRYEMSLPLPKNDHHSFNIYRFTVRVTLIIAISLSFVSLIYLLLGGFEINLFWFGAITILSTFFVAFINLGTNWSIRMKHFGSISRQRIISSGVSNALKVGLGFIGIGSLALLISTLIGYVISCYEFFREFLLGKKHYVSSKNKQIALAKEYKEFPTVNLLHISTDLGRDLMIALFIGYNFGKDVFGLYGHAYAMLTLPLKVIGASISQVFYSKCSELVNEGKSTYELMIKTMKTLVLLSIIPFSILFFFGEPLFSFVFGKSWAASGLYAEVMSIWLLMNFLISPLSSLPLVLRRQKEFFLLSLLGGGLQLLAFGVMPIFYGTSKSAMIEVLWFTSITQFVYYSLVIFVILHYAKMGVKQSSKAL